MEFLVITETGQDSNIKRSLGIDGRQTQRGDSQIHTSQGQTHARIQAQLQARGTKLKDYEGVGLRDCF